MLEHALKLVEKGWYVFPCRERDGKPYEKDGEMITPLAKTPYTAKGLYDASNDIETVKSLWGRFPNAMIGVNCEMSKLFVVDLDVKNNVDGIGNWMALDIDDAGALHSKTPSGGMHIIWKGLGKTSTNGRLGIDTRSIGGYFIAPPSEIMEGEYKGKYFTLDDWDIDPAVIPDGVMDKLFPSENTTKAIAGNGGIKKQLSRPTLEYLINGAVAGDRNNSLFKAMADFAGCGFTKEEAKEKCYEIARKGGLSDIEIADVARKAFSKERTPSIPDSIQAKIAEKMSPALIANSISEDEMVVIEEAVLCGLMIDNKSISSIADILEQKDFQNIRYGKIYITIVGLYESGIYVDSITLYEELSRINSGVELSYLESLSTKHPVVTEHIIDYAQVVKQRSGLREYQKLLAETHESTKRGLSLSEIMRKFSKKASDIAIRVSLAADAPLTSEQSVDTVLERHRAIKAGEIVQRETGFTYYDHDSNGGFFIPELIMVAGRPADGKSALLLSLANNMAIGKKTPVGFFTLEMSINEVMSRLITQITGLPYSMVYTGKGLTPKQWDEIYSALEIIKRSPLYFHDPSGITVNELRLQMRRLREEKGVDVFCVDQLEQIVLPDSSDPEYVKVNHITYELKDATKDLNSTIFLAHQLKREVTDRKYKDAELILSDLSQAGEKAIHQAWAIQHEMYEGKIIKSKIKVLKNRNNEKKDFVVQFIASRMLFANPTGKMDESSVNNAPDYIDDHQAPVSHDYMDEDPAFRTESPDWSQRHSKEGDL